MQTVEGNAGSVKRHRMGIALVLVAVFATLAVALGPDAALGNGGREHRRGEVSFTKWFISIPADPSTQAGALMAGVVGGDVGHGRYAAQIMSGDTAPRPHLWLGHVRSEFHGDKHTFIADLQITEDDDLVPSRAAIEGVVVHGWLKGARVSGRYRRRDTCPIRTPANANGTICFQGTLHLQPA